MKFQTKKTKLIARVMLLVLLLTSVLILTACIEKEGLEAGFKWREHPDASMDYFCAYRSDKREFNIDDVTLTFYYGGLRGLDCYAFRLYFENKNGDVYLIKQVTNHNPDDYKVHCEGYTRWDSYRVFDFCENITIPKELFVNDSGYIFFCLDVIHVSWQEDTWYNANREIIYYNVVGNTVELSEKLFEQ